ncbi:MAG: DedA family protein [Phycisphaerae bacterium]|nr:DedA family protein [Phycisphaerae bacterium]
MDFHLLANMMATIGLDEGTLVSWLETAFYPTLLGILIIASLGLPIPEDIPLIAAGVILSRHPGVATWPATLLVALVGIMSGDLILYMFGRLAGPSIVGHKGVRWLITPRRYAQTARAFKRHGMWACFFGRFFVGIRAMMCMTAGATRFPYWRFFIADCAGALLSIPLFVLLGYWFAGMIPVLRQYLVGVQGILLGVAILGAIGLVIALKIRAMRRLTRQPEDVRVLHSVDDASSAA